MSHSLLKRVYDSGAGAVVSKSIGPEPRSGHKNPTLVCVDAGTLNAMGLPNPGIDYFIKEIKKLRNDEIPIVVSFFGGSIKEFVEVARQLDRVGADALELNASCPNVDDGFGMIATDANTVETVTAAVKNETKKPLFVKLSPNVTDIGSIAKAAESGGADAITAINTLKGLKVDIHFRKPILSNITGGLSGPAIKPIALRCVWEIAQVVDIPIIGCGGITSGEDAIEYMLCGASAVEIGYEVMNKGVGVFREVTNDIELYLTENGFSSAREVVGLALE
jgi:dihydroorotate dehydrogenase (NAD+) catalytic subunit